MTAADRTVYTLGPDGTDAHAEATRLFDAVAVAPTFEKAVCMAHAARAYALVATGFVERAGGAITDLWVNLHFRNLSRMRVVGVWESPTKLMCLATRRPTLDLGDVQSVALHPATEVFAAQFVPCAERRYVDAKPLAVQQVSDGVAEACIGSVDVVSAAGLTVRKEFQPSMVWCLYQAIEAGELTDSRTMTNHPNSLLRSAA
ncbi:hypothetical protein [Streptomyces sp. NPDC058548]|uniref:hypothetical protein n=1 Tax=Streptomyces sp. NPDC058548 TaxID=3346545 RepID=UPI00365B9ADD